MKKILALLLVVAPVALADLIPPPAFDCGDAVVASYTPACVIDPPPPPSDRIARHDRSTAYLRDVSSALVGAVTQAFGSIYVARTNGDTTTTIALLDAHGGLHPLVNVAGTVTALAPAGADLLAVVYRSGNNPEIRRFNARGEAVSTIALPAFDHYIQSIDLAADQCTLFFSAATSVERYDICSRTTLPRFAAVFNSSLRILPDGGILAASGRDLVRFDAVGNRIATFKLPLEIGALTLDPNPSVAWIVTSSSCSPYGNAQLMQVNINIGSIIAGPQNTTLPSGFSLAVQGEWRASVDKVAPGRRRAAGR